MCPSWKKGECEEQGGAITTHKHPNVSFKRHACREDVFYSSLSPLHVNTYDGVCFVYESVRRELYSLFIFCAVIVQMVVCLSAKVNR